jgi:hypothetical protein
MTQTVTYLNNDSLVVAGYTGQAADGTVVLSFRGTEPSQLQVLIVPACAAAGYY